ncbi:DEAD/DEAH box helicase [Candidatus Bathyarchaeota archaeon]|nr:MAG: DEAD/DEAH box helicase [Candidatus Bathyarchaeota archaeon]HHL41841.1 DEAD/DEAH box helicase [Candidatus Bathyarchaeota archaeon]
MYSREIEMSRFDELPLSPEVLKGIRKMRFTQMTPIQIEAIPLLLEGRDIIGQAQTGTGKTAAFSIPMINQIDATNPDTQGLVIAPTRELASQIAVHVRGLAKYTDARILCFHGGGNIYKQADLMRRPAHIIVATPGRLLDLIYRRRAVDLSTVKYAVVDEADKMLELGFIREVRDILSKLPFVRQTSLWSATITEDLLEIATRYMRHPRKVIVSSDEIAQENIEQYFLDVTDENRVDSLYKILNNVEVDRGFIFCNTRETVDQLVELIQEEGYLVEALHGGFTQTQRDQAYTKLLKRQVRFLVSTDVASRGIDIKGVTHIINYEVPEDPEVYYHRIGRTARIGEAGKAITLVSESEMKYWEKIREMTGTTLLEYRVR